MEVQNRPCFTTVLTTRFKVIPLPEYLTSTMQVGNLALMLCLLILCTQVGVMQPCLSSMSRFVGMVWGWLGHVDSYESICQNARSKFGRILWSESAIMHLKSRFDTFEISVAALHVAFKHIQTHFDIKIWDLSSPRFGWSHHGLKSPYCNLSPCDAQTFQDPIFHCINSEAGKMGPLNRRAMSELKGDFVTQDWKTNPFYGKHFCYAHVPALDCGNN